MGPHMAKPALADTLIQTPVRFLPHPNRHRQALIVFIFKTGLKKGF
jgi:hypothetical protein